MLIFVSRKDNNLKDSRIVNLLIFNQTKRLQFEIKGKCFIMIIF
jgi:hypothetical protein